MLERILRPRGGRDQAQELPFLEVRERRAQIVIAETADRPEERLIELLADDGGGLQHVLERLAESIDARRQEGLHRGGKSEDIDRRRQAIGAALADEAAGRHQRLHHFFGEKRVALGALADAIGKIAERAVRSEQVDQQLAAGLFAEWRQRELVVVG